MNQVAAELNSSSSDPVAGSSLSPAAAMVVTSLTMTEAETSVRLPCPANSSSSTAAVVAAAAALGIRPESPFELSRNTVADFNANLQKLPAPEDPATLTSVDHSAMNSNGHSEGFPSAILTCRPNSHPFKERTLFGVHQQVKIGRSVARSRPSDTNAIFDCKVLSRNHALLWYKDGKFFLQDTKSSNGTFVNNSRLSKGAEESEPREICSGDVLQFGVDVQENTKKLTHGCIIATVRLFLPDGKEAKASPTIVSSSAATTLPPQDLYQLNQYIQEALVREQMLETKLAMVQRLAEQTNQASDEAWKSLIDEDRLLTRVEILESQLSTYGKGMTEDKLREETKRLMEEKELYQETAKQTLKKLVDEKLEAVKKTKELEKNLSNIEDEYSLLKELHEKDVQENRGLALQVSKLSSDLEQALSKTDSEPDKSSILSSANANITVSEASSSDNNMPSSAVKSNILSGATVTVSVDDEAATTTAVVELGTAAPTNVKSEPEVEELKSERKGKGDDSSRTSSQDQDELNDNEQVIEEVSPERKSADDNVSSGAEFDELKAASVMDTSIDSVGTISNEEERLRNETVTDDSDEPWKEKLETLESELAEYKDSYEQVLSCNKEITCQLEQVQERLEQSEVQLKEKAFEVDELKDRTANNESDLRSQITKLSNDHLTLTTENEELKLQLGNFKHVIEEYEQKLEALEKVGRLNTSSDTSLLERSLQEAETKISELLKIKERFAEVDAEKTNLALNLSELEEEMDVLSTQTRTATACSIVPLVILVLAVMVAYLPALSSLFGTAEKL